MSGFFFCGMIDEPVDQLSCSRTNPNSAVAQMTMSSLSLERSTAVIARIQHASATRSRDAVASSELGTAREKPRSAATCSGSSPKVLPARAAAP